MEKIWILENSQDMKEKKPMIKGKSTVVMHLCFKP